MRVQRIHRSILRRLALALVLTCAVSAAYGQTMTAKDASVAADNGRSSNTGSAAAVEGPAHPAAGNFFQRFAKAYTDDWKSTPSGDSEPKFRGWPSPVDGPPFPF